MVGTLCPGLSVLTRHGLMDVGCRWGKRARLSRDGVASHRGALRKALIWLGWGDSNSGAAGGFRRCDGGGRWLARKGAGFDGRGRFGGRGSGHAPTYGTPEVRQGGVRWTVARTDCPEAQAGGQGGKGCAVRVTNRGAAASGETGSETVQWSVAGRTYVLLPGGRQAMPWRQCLDLLRDKSGKRVI